MDFGVPLGDGFCHSGIINDKYYDITYQLSRFNVSFAPRYTGRIMLRPSKKLD